MKSSEGQLNLLFVIRKDIRRKIQFAMHSLFFNDKILLTKTKDSNNNWNNFEKFSAAYYAYISETKIIRSMEVISVEFYVGAGYKPGDGDIILKERIVSSFPNCWPGIELPPPANHDLIELADLFLVRGMKGSRSEGLCLAKHRILLRSAARKVVPGIFLGTWPHPSLPPPNGGKWTPPHLPSFSL